MYLLYLCTTHAVWKTKCKLVMCSTHVSLTIMGKQKLYVTVYERVHTKFYVLHIVNVQAHMFTDMHV